MSGVEAIHSVGHRNDDRDQKKEKKDPINGAILGNPFDGGLPGIKDLLPDMRPVDIGDASAATGWLPKHMSAQPSPGVGDAQQHINNVAQAAQEHINNAQQAAQEHINNAQQHINNVAQDWAKGGASGNESTADGASDEAASTPSGVSGVANPLGKAFDPEVLKKLVGGNLFPGAGGGAAAAEDPRAPAAHAGAQSSTVNGEGEVTTQNAASSSSSRPFNPFGLPIPPGLEKMQDQIQNALGNLAGGVSATKTQKDSPTPADTADHSSPDALPPSEMDNATSSESLSEIGAQVNLQN